MHRQALWSTVKAQYYGKSIKLIVFIKSAPLDLQLSWQDNFASENISFEQTWTPYTSRLRSCLKEQIISDRNSGAEKRTKIALWRSNSSEVCAADHWQLDDRCIGTTYNFRQKASAIYCRIAWTLRQIAHNSLNQRIDSKQVWLQEFLPRAYRAATEASVQALQHAVWL